MPFVAIFCGALLIVIGVAGYVYGMMQQAASLTALIPAAFGVVMVLLGTFAQSKENLRKHLMHAAAVVALLGFLATAGRLFSKMSELSMSGAVVSQIATAVVCLAFLIFAIRTFIAARAG